MAITLQQLNVLRAIVAHGRIGLAAAALGTSQPSVSQQLRRLEERLGFALLESRDGRLVPTERGAQACQIAELVCIGVTRLGELAEEASRGSSGTLTVGANTTGGMYLVPELLRAFSRDHPSVTVRLLIGHVSELAAAVTGGVCDVAVVGGPVAARELATATLFTDELALVVSPADIFAPKRVIDIADLRTRRFVLPGPGSRTRLVAETALRNAGVELDRVLEYPDTETVKKAIESGLGIGYLSREGVRRELDQGYLVEVQVRGVRISRPFQAFWLKERRSLSVVESFVATAKRQVSLRTFRASAARTANRAGEQLNT